MDIDSEGKTTFPLPPRTLSVDNNYPRLINEHQFHSALELLPSPSATVVVLPPLHLPLLTKASHSTQINFLVHRVSQNGPVMTISLIAFTLEQ